MDKTKRSRNPTRLSGLTMLLAGSVWAIRESTHRQIIGDFNHYLRAGPAADSMLEHVKAAQDKRAADVAQAQDTAPGVAIISLYGTIFPRGSMMVDLCGAVSPHSFADQVTQAASDPAVGSIILDVDSGGGAVSGIDVAAEAVRRAALVKQVTAVCNTTMCSAAYWLASQASEVVITPAGEIGSIGVIGTHTDETAAMDEMGLKVTYVRSTPRKALGQPDEPMEGAALDQWQSEVDRIHTLFVQAVAQGRGRPEADVRENWATGDVWFGQDAVVNGLADRVATLDDVVAEHLQRASDAQARQARSERRRASSDFRRLDARLAELQALRDGPRPSPEAAGAANLRAQALYTDLDAACQSEGQESLADYQSLRAECAELQNHFARLARQGPPQEESPMKIKLQAADGTFHEVENTPEAIAAFLSGQYHASASAASETAAAATQAAEGRLTEAQATHTARLTELGALFGLTPEQATASDLTPWQRAAGQASEVGAYRDALLTELEALAVTVDGNTSAGTQVVKLARSASTPDLLATVTAYRERRDATVPAGRQSKITPDTNGKEEQQGKKTRPSTFDHN